MSDLRACIGLSEFHLCTSHKYLSVERKNKFVSICILFGSHRLKGRSEESILTFYSLYKYNHYPILFEAVTGSKTCIIRCARWVSPFTTAFQVGSFLEH